MKKYSKFISFPFVLRRRIVVSVAWQAGQRAGFFSTWSFRFSASSARAGSRQTLSFFTALFDVKKAFYSASLKLTPMRLRRDDIVYMRVTPIHVSFLI